QAAQSSGFGGCSEIFNRLDFQLVVEYPHLLRAYALQLQYFKHRTRYSLQLLLMVLALARFDQFLDLLGEIRAHSGNFGKLAIRVACNILQALRVTLDGPLGPVVRRSLELPLGIFLEDLHHVGNFFKYCRDLVVLHAFALWLRRMESFYSS